MKRRSSILLTGLLALSAAVACDSAPEADSSYVAQAGEQQWTVEQAAAVLAPRNDLPARPDVVRALANLWLDYTLLATAAAQDTTLAALDVSTVVQQLTDDRLLTALRDSVITPDSLSSAELRARYQREAPGSFVQARHILLAWPAAATPVQLDSVRRVAASLQGDIVAGRIPFDSAARRFSHDSASAQQGGNIGLVTRGQLVPPLENAIFSLAENQVSQPVESPYGLHIIEVTGRQTPTLQQFRQIAAARQAMHAESVFVAGLEKNADVRIADDAPGMLRNMAADPRMTLERGDRDHAMLRFRNGEVTRGEALMYMQQVPPNVRNQIAMAQDNSIGRQVLMSIARRELLLAETQRRGWAVRPEIKEQMTAAARRNLVDAARQLGLLQSGANAKASGPQTQASVDSLLARILSGQQREVTPLGAMSYVLREKYRAEINEPGVTAAAARIEELRKK